jgi:hypothetical protein
MFNFKNIAVMFCISILAMKVIIFTDSSLVICKQTGAISLYHTPNGLNQKCCEINESNHKNKHLKNIKSCCKTTTHEHEENYSQDQIKCCDEILLETQTYIVHKKVEASKSVVTNFFQPILISYSAKKSNYIDSVYHNKAPPKPIPTLTRLALLSILIC